MLNRLTFLLLFLFVFLKKCWSFKSIWESYLESINTQIFYFLVENRTFVTNGYSNVVYTLGNCSHLNTNGKLKRRQTSNLIKSKRYEKLRRNENAHTFQVDELLLLLLQCNCICNTIEFVYNLYVDDLSIHRFPPPKSTTEHHWWIGPKLCLCFFPVVGSIWMYRCEFVPMYDVWISHFYRKLCCAGAAFLTYYSYYIHLFLAHQTHHLSTSSVCVRILERGEAKNGLLFNIHRVYDVIRDAIDS